MNRKDRSNNIPFSIGSEIEMWKKLMKEVKLNRYAGPFNEIPYEYFIQSPIGPVRKENNQTRLIFHLSYDFGTSEEKGSLNYHTPKSLCTVKYRDLDYAVKTCLELWSSMMNECPLSDREEIATNIANEILPPIFMAKSNLMSAFRILPILPSQHCLLLMKATDPRSEKNCFLCRSVSSLWSQQQLQAVPGFF